MVNVRRKHLPLHFGIGIIVVFLTFQLISFGFDPPPRKKQSAQTVLKDSPLIFISDTQSPLWVETLFLNENRNDDARSVLFEYILTDDPAAVFHLGDMVGLGSDQSKWSPIDSFLTRLEKSRIPFFPALGNHELLFFPFQGRKNFNDRFPVAANSGYLQRSGRVAVILLNSNSSYLSETEATYQREWYMRTLDSLDADPDITWVIVGCHHSPYTNSTVVSPSVAVQKEFVGPYIRSRKGVLFLSGHAHAFEHFVESGKDFMVIGGGGGLQQPLYQKSEQRWTDHFPEKTDIRRFHYLRCVIQETSMLVEVQMITEDFAGIETAYQISFQKESTSAPHAASSLASP